MYQWQGTNELRENRCVQDRGVYWYEQDEEVWCNLNGSNMKSLDEMVKADLKEAGPYGRDKIF